VNLEERLLWEIPDLCHIANLGNRLVRLCSLSKKARGEFGVKSISARCDDGTESI